MLPALKPINAVTPLTQPHGLSFVQHHLCYTPIYIWVALSVLTFFLPFAIIAIPRSPDPEYPNDKTSATPTHDGDEEISSSPGPRDIIPIFIPPAKKMTSVLLPYSTSHFNNLPSLHGATTEFASKSGRAFFDDVFAPLVIKHGLESKVGLGLLHRHFRLKRAEKMVEFNDVSTPWTTTTTTSAESEEEEEEDKGGPHEHLGGEVLPCAWLLRGGKFMPYEFFYSPMGCRRASVDLDGPDVRAFLAEFVDAAESAGVAGVVALRLYPEYADCNEALEMTQGRSYITLKRGQYLAPLADRDRFVTTMWFVGSPAPGAPGPVVTKKCLCYTWIKGDHLHCMSAS